MRRFGAFVLVATLAVPALAAPPARKVPATPALAKTLVDGVKVNAEDVVLVRTNAEAMPLAELVVAEISRRGATVVFEYAPASIVRAIIGELPDAYLERVSPVAAAQTQLVNAIIELGPVDDPVLDIGLDPARLSKANVGRHAVQERYYGTEIRRLSFGGTSFPGDESAKLFKADAATLSRVFWEAVAVKTPILEDKVNRLRRSLSGLKVVRLKTPNGTDVELRLAARPIFANLGVIDEEVAQRQGPKEAAIPAGEVATVPTEFFASGPLVVDSAEFNGVIVKDLRFKFVEGKATLESGGENFQIFKRAFDAATGDKDVIGSLSIGVNEASKPTGLYRSPEMAGVVTVGIGYNRAVGGFNGSAFQARFKLLNATVKVDDQTVVENGVLKLK